MALFNMFNNVLFDMENKSNYQIIINTVFYTVLQQESKKLIQLKMKSMSLVFILENNC